MRLARDRLPPGVWACPEGPASNPIGVSFAFRRAKLRSSPFLRVIPLPPSPSVTIASVPPPVSVHRLLRNIQHRAPHDEPSIVVPREDPEVAPGRMLALVLLALVDHVEPERHDGRVTDHLDIEIEFAVLDHARHVAELDERGNQQVAAFDHGAESRKRDRHVLVKVRRHVARTLLPPRGPDRLHRAPDLFVRCHGQRSPHFAATSMRSTTSYCAAVTVFGR